MYARTVFGSRSSKIHFVITKSDDNQLCILFFILKYIHGQLKVNQSKVPVQDLEVIPLNIKLEYN